MTPTTTTEQNTDPRPSSEQDSPLGLAATSDRSRRVFLKEALGTGLSLGALGSLTGCLGDIDRRGNDGVPPVRRSFASLEKSSDPNGIVDTYKEAVKIMKGKPSSNPHSWEYQAHIHGRVGWNECEHGSWMFFPWHRAYLFYFEDICRKLTDNKDFALPYWNWVQNPTVPDAFWGGSSNPLYDSTRTITPREPISPRYVAPPVIGGILNDPNFLRFAGGWDDALDQPSFPKGTGAGECESPTHNGVHVEVGGNMASAASPLDPLFWVHHGMIDYLWWVWNAVRRNPVTNDSDWFNGTAPPMTNGLGGDFFDINGDTVTDQDISPFKTLLMPLVSYRYEKSFVGTNATMGAGQIGNDVALANKIPAAAAQIEPETPDDGIELAGKDTEELRSFIKEGAEVELELVERVPVGEDELEVHVGDPLSLVSDVSVEDVRSYLTGEKKGRLSLSAKEIEPPRHEDFFTAILVNQLEAIGELTLDNPHYAGGFAFFTSKEPEMKFSYSVDVTDALYVLYQEGILEEEDQLSFQLIAAPNWERELEDMYTIGSLDFDITRSIINGEVREKPLG